MKRSYLKSKADKPKRAKHPISIPNAMGTGKVKQPVFRDRQYHSAIKSQELPCAVSGLTGSASDQVVFAHMGITGKGMKAPDNEAIPMLDSLHKRSHSQAVSMGFQTFWCELFMKDRRLLLDVLKAFARDYHSKWEAANYPHRSKSEAA